MVLNTGTLVTAPIRPNDDQDTYPSALTMAQSPYQAVAGQRYVSVGVADATVNHYPRIRWGSIPVGAITNANLDTRLTNSEIRSNRLKSFTQLGTGGSQRVAIAIPTAFGTPAFAFNGFTNTDFLPTYLPTYANAFGVTVDMTVWISNQFYNSPLDNFIIS